jgi:hypothetical protein
MDSMGAWDLFRGLVRDTNVCLAGIVPIEGGDHAVKWAFAFACPASLV